MANKTKMKTEKKATEHPYIKKLKELGVYEQFEANFNEFTKWRKGATIKKLARQEPNFEEFVQGAFVWKYTPEGMMFWLEISKSEEYGKED